MYKHQSSKKGSFYDQKMTFYLKKLNLIPVQ
jgi:hypothetical protein